MWVNLFFNFCNLTHFLAMVSFLVFKKDYSSARNIIEFPLLTITLTLTLKIQITELTLTH